MKLILDGRFILHEYQGSFKNKPVTGMAIYGYNLESGKYESVWIDSYHNGAAMMFSSGKPGDSDVNVLGSYVWKTPDEEQHWGWRTQIEWKNDSEMIITAFNVSPEGEETIAIETTYKRVQ